MRIRSNRNTGFGYIRSSQDVYSMDDWIESLEYIASQHNYEMVTDAADEGSPGFKCEMVPQDDDLPDVYVDVVQDGMTMYLDISVSNFPDISSEELRDHPDAMSFRVKKWLEVSKMVEDFSRQSFQMS